MRIALIILFIFILNDVFSQTIDSAIAVFAKDREEWFVKKNGVPSAMEVDYANIRGNKIDFNNNTIRLFVNSTNVSEVDMSFQEIENGAGRYVTSAFYTIITGLYPTNDTILTNQGRMYYSDGVRWIKRAKSN